MKKTYNKVDTSALPVYLWTDDVEESAAIQIEHLTKYRFAFHHIAIMPDVHMGKGMPIGGVMATDGVIIPNAVGTDIGCGMVAVKTPWTVAEISADNLKKIRELIFTVVPVGKGGRRTSRDERLMPVSTLPKDGTKIVGREYQSIIAQLGTLGSGNHFIEIQKDTEDNVWVMIHSGSRNIGSRVAEYYNNLAVKLDEQEHTGIPTAWGLACLYIDSDAGQNYLSEMKYCVDFAFANRKSMIESVAEVFNNVIRYKKVDLDGVINIAHNYASLENHFGKDVWVHRKGATSATVGEVGIIPGSMGTKSYIVKGLGNPDSFNSCSHGAGRKMSRGAAKKDLDLAKEIKKMDDQGIIHGMRSKADIDEAAGSYKDIEKVIEQESDLVEVIVELRPIAVVKA
ncbi:MAG: RtcB family protein [Caldisericia bacterium]